jgi:hypothetical protein
MIKWQEQEAAVYVYENILPTKVLFFLKLLGKGDGKG